MRRCSTSPRSSPTPPASTVSASSASSGTSNCRWYLPTIGLVSVLTFVANFNAFDLIYSVKGALAGPNFASDILGTFFYRTFFGFQLQLGNPTMGAAVATVMFFIILVGVCFYLFVIQRRLRRYAF